MRLIVFQPIVAAALFFAVALLGRRIDGMELLNCPELTSGFSEISQNPLTAILCLGIPLLGPIVLGGFLELRRCIQWLLYNSAARGGKYLQRGENESAEWYLDQLPIRPEPLISDASYQHQVRTVTGYDMDTFVDAVLTGMAARYRNQCEVGVSPFIAGLGPAQDAYVVTRRLPIGARVSVYLVVNQLGDMLEILSGYATRGFLTPLSGTVKLLFTWAVLWAVCIGTIVYSPLVAVGFLALIVLINGCDFRSMLHGLRGHMASAVLVRNAYFFQYTNARFAETQTALWDSMDKSIDDAARGFSRMNLDPRRSGGAQDDTEDEPQQARW